MARSVTSVWMRPSRGARGPAAAYGRDDVAAAAVRLADRSGLEAVSMRELARELGVGQSSLYRHVGGREDVVDLMADAVVGEVGRPALTGDAVEDLLAVAACTRGVQLRHPWYLDLHPDPLRLGPHGLDHLEHLLCAMDPVGLPGPARLEIVAVVNALVAQFSRAQRGAPGDPGRRDAQLAYLASAVTRQGRPRLAAALAVQGPPVEGEGGDAVFARTMRAVVPALLRDAAT